MELPPPSPAFAKLYDLGRVLSNTSRAIVVEAVQIATRQGVAIKFFAPEADEPAARAVAAKLAARAALRHPNVVAVVETGVLGRVPYLAMELLDGGSLAARLAQGPLPLAQAADVALDCLKAVSAARRKGFGTPALTADAVLLASGGQAKLAAIEAGAAPADDRAVVTAIARLVGATLTQDEGGGLVAQLDAATSIEGLEAALRPHAGRSAALKDEPPRQSAVYAPLPHAEPLPDKPVIVGNGRGFGATQVLGVPRRTVVLAASEGPPVAPPDRPAYFYALAALAGAVAFSAAYCVIFLCLPCFKKEPPRLLEQARDIESARALISWKTTPACYSSVEYWQATSTQNKLRTRKVPVMQAEHRHSLPDLKPDTTYNFRFLFSYQPSEEAELFASEVFDFTTRPEIQIFNIHVDEYATKAVVTWETNLRTDTTVKYGPTEQYSDLRTNPEQRSETIHSITLEGMTPDTTHHYQILASDPRGRGQPKPSEDLQFRTSKEDACWDGGRRENAGLVNLTKAYVDKLTRMTPDEREKLKTSIQKFTDPRVKLSAADKQALVGTRTAAANDGDFNTRLQMARAWFRELAALNKRVGDHDKVCRLLQTLYYTNRYQGAQRLDACLKRLLLAEHENMSLDDLEKTLEAGAEIEVIKGPVPATGPDDLLGEE